jgi:hypothetical protein
MAPRRNTDRSHVTIAAANTRALRIHSIVNDSRFFRRGARPVMLDKTGGDMVPLRLNLWPPKETRPPG